MAQPSDRLYAFIGRYIRTVTAAEVLLLLRREPARVWTADTAAAQLRSSAAAIAEHLAFFADAGLLAKSAGGYRYDGADRAADETVAELAQAYAERPVAIVELIYSEPERKLRILADAFKLKKD